MLKWTNKQKTKRLRTNQLGRLELPLAIRKFYEISSVNGRSFGFERTAFQFQWSDNQTHVT